MTRALAPPPLHRGEWERGFHSPSSTCRGKQVHHQKTLLGTSASLQPCVCFLFGAVGNQGVPHKQASGRNYCSHVRGKYHMSPWHTTSNRDFFFPLDHTENTGLWCSNLDPRHSLLRSQSVHLRFQTALSKRSQRHVTAAQSKEEERQGGVLKYK